MFAGVVRFLLPVSRDPLIFAYNHLNKMVLPVISNAEDPKRIALWVVDKMSKRGYG
jgi:hypothetical protein